MDGAAWTRRSALAAFALLGGCGGAPGDYRPSFVPSAASAREYSFAVHPLYTPQQLDRIAQLLPKGSASGARSNDPITAR